jgi:hypothetical protein
MVAVLAWVSGILTLDAAHKTSLVVEATLHAVEVIEAVAPEAELNRLVTADS